MRKIDHKIAYLLIMAVFLGAGTVLAAKYFNPFKKNLTAVKDNIEEVIPTPTAEAPEAVKEQISKSPPKHKKQTVSVTSSGSGQTTTISDNGLSAAESAKYLSNCKSASSPSGVSVADETGRYPSIGVTLTSYLASLRWGGEINSFCGISVADAGNTGWSGQYTASYRTDGNGKIVSASGAVILNASYYSQFSEATFNEYMKLILSHEYGHHYTQYHKWVDLNLPITSRFPDSYYSVRPLSKSATVVDCSESWSTCESEIIAEDYSYIYSGYGLHQMADLFGYPSSGTKTWLDNLSSATSPSSPSEPPPAQNQNSAPANSNTNNNTNTNSNDTIAPVVNITEPASPYSWDASTPTLIIKVRSSDNVGVTKIKVYINGQYQGQWSAVNIDLSWAYSNAPAGTYIFKAQAIDAAGNAGETTLTINKS